MTATTTAPPQTVNEAHKAVSAARDTHDELRRKVAAGDTTITAAKIASAADAVVYAELRLDAAVVAEEARQASQHEADVEALRTDIAAFPDTFVAAARANYQAAVEALKFLADNVFAHEDNLRVLQGRAAVLGVVDEVPNASLRPELHNYPDLAVQDATGRLRGAHALSSDADAAAASEAATKADARSRTIRVRRDLADATGTGNLFRAQADAFAATGRDEAADEMLARAAKADADFERLTAELARLEALAA